MWKSVQKFRLDLYDLPTMLSNVSTLLRPMLLDIDSRHKTGIPKLFYVFAPCIAISYFYTYLISSIWFVFWRCRGTCDLVPRVIIISLSVGSELATAKYIPIFINRKKIVTILDNYRDCDAHVEQNSRLSQNMMKTLRIVKRRALVFWVILIFNGLTYFVKPLLLPGRNLVEEDQIILGLEPMIESPNYEMSYTILFASLIYTFYVPAGISALLIVLAGYTEAQMLALCEELLHLWEDAEQSYNNYVNKTEANTSSTSIQREQYMNKCVKANLERIAKRHATNITLITQVEEVYKWAIAAGFLILIICTITALLGGLENTYIELPFDLIQITMDCFTGQRLMDANLTFENAVYDCKWEKFDVNNMKTVLLILQNSQKTMTLSAGGISTLSYVSLMAILKAIYSAYATLRTTMRN